MFKQAIILSALLATSSSVCLAASSDTQTLEISLKDFHYGYSEVVGDSETAWMKGIHVSYKNQDNNTRQYWKITYDQTKQNTHYDGFIETVNPVTHTVISTTPYQGITNNKITNTEFILANPVYNTTNEYAYIGIGFHNWNRNLTGASGYLEKYSWNYIPIGYRSEYKINAKWDGAFDLSARFMFNGKMNVQYNGGTTSGMGDKFNLGNKPGFKLELPYTYNMDSNWSLVVTPWYEYSAIGQSNILADGYAEPDSTTHQYGVDLGVSYTF